MVNSRRAGLLKPTRHSIRYTPVGDWSTLPLPADQETNMTKSELIDRISSINLSATREFLLEFTRRELADYMRQLQTLGLIPGDEGVRADSVMESNRAATA